MYKESFPNVFYSAALDSIDAAHAQKDRAIYTTATYKFLKFDTKK
jgi:hypothetical protein